MSVPLIETIQAGRPYVCSRNLFPFINRSLNNLGLQASVDLIDDEMVRFQVINHTPPKEPMS